MTTTIFLNGKIAYRREYDFTKSCKKSEVDTLIENRKNFDVIITKEHVKKYDKIFQKAGFYMTTFEEYGVFEYKLHYEHI